MITMMMLLKHILLLLLVLLLQQNRISRMNTHTHTHTRTAVRGSTRRAQGKAWSQTLKINDGHSREREKESKSNKTHLIHPISRSPAIVENIAHTRMSCNLYVSAGQTITTWNLPDNWKPTASGKEVTDPQQLTASGMKSRANLKADGVWQIMMIIILIIIIISISSCNLSSRRGHLQSCMV